MRYDPDVHRRRSIRLRGYDYARAGAFFVTVCVQGRQCLFGEVAGGEMFLNEAGSSVQTVWQTLPERHPHLVLDEFAVMPNHFHGILILNDRRGESCIRPDAPGNGRGEPRVRPMGQNDRNDQGDHDDQGDHKDRPYGTAPDSLGRIMQAFKSMTTVEYIRGVDQHGWPPFPGRLWQRNYYERVIRDDDELDRARQYIGENPMQWHLDAENPDNLR